MKSRLAGCGPGLAKGAKANTVDYYFANPRLLGDGLRQSSDRRKRKAAGEADGLQLCL